MKTQLLRYSEKAWIFCPIYYRRSNYYRHLIEDWDFEDDNNGGWTIDTENKHYSFYLLNGNWQMIDQNGDTVDTFPPFSTLEEDAPKTTGGHEIHDDGADSPRVVGKVTGGTQTASEGGSSTEGTIQPIVRQAVLRAILHNPEQTLCRSF